MAKIQKEPQYSIKNIEFNISNRKAKIYFNQETLYKTIERTVTRNYQKTNIYSDWKSRIKVIEKTIILSNETLENLREHENELIASFSYQILKEIDHKDIHPSWMQEIEINENYKIQEREIKLYFSNEFNELQVKLENVQENLKLKENHLFDLNEKIGKQLNKQNKLENKINKISKDRTNLIKCLFTIFIFLYFNSNLRKKWLSNKLKKVKEKLTLLNNELITLQSEIKKLNENLNNYISCQKRSVELKEEKLTKLLKTKGNKLDGIKSLRTEVDNSFFDLKETIGLPYKSIKGCYVIKNKFNGKHYVGQSKDVLKRIKQHFNGLQPNNIIFAEDYYSEPEKNRGNIFSIKIIECSTKDELDSLEKELIEKYDSFNRGYNKTSGNV
ncbi:MAG: GIY-YIG nuclease family protein [Mycoplasma sp.]